MWLLIHPTQNPQARASVANKLDPAKCDFVREYLEAAQAAADSADWPCVWATKAQLMRGGRVGTELIRRTLAGLTGAERPLTPEAVDSFLSVVGKDTGMFLSFKTSQDSAKRMDKVS